MKLGTLFEKFWLGLRSMLMTVLFPGTVAGYIPYRILAPVSARTPGAWVWTQFAALVVIGSGLTILLRCVWAFAHHGRGTLAPFDEPRRLVVLGPYRYVRNPMYVGVLLILLGEALFFWSRSLLLYAAFCFLIANVFVIVYEERRLRAKFGEAYTQYCKDVGRWIPGRSFRKDSRRETR